MAEEISGVTLDEEFARIAKETRDSSASNARAQMGESYSIKSQRMTPGSNATQIAERGASSVEGNLGRVVGKAGTNFIAGAARFLGPLGTLLTAISPSELSGAGDSEISQMSTDARDKANMSRVAQSNTATAEAVATPNDPMELLQLAASATANQDIAKSKTKDVATQVGTAKNRYSYVLQPGERLVKTFGGTKVQDQSGRIVSTEPEIPALLKAPAVDERQVVANQIEGVKPGSDLDVQKEFGSLKSLSGDERLDRANQLLVNIGMQVSREQDRIRSIAAQESGVNDAQAAYQNFTRLAQAMRPGQRVQEVEDSRKSLNDAMIIANKREADLIAASPSLRQLKEYHDAITRDITFTARRQDRRDVRTARQEDKDAELVAITPEILVNGRFALGMNKPANAEEEQKMRRAIYNSARGNKQLALALEADKNNIVSLLTHPDVKVRTYAFSITRGLERQYQELDEKAPDPSNVTSIAKLVENPDNWIKENSALIPNDMKKRFKEESMMASGEKAKTETTQGHRIAQVNYILDQRFRASYDQMQKWTWTDPSIKKVIDSTFKAGGSKNVSMEDGIIAVVNSEMRAPDGRIMTFQDKKDATMGSLEVTLGNDRKSFLRPSADNYGPEFRDKVVNLFNRAFIRKEKPFLDSAMENPFRF